MVSKAVMKQVPVETASILEERIEMLRGIFPEAFSENKVDFQKLRATLGDFVETGPERYRFTWAGKPRQCGFVIVPLEGLSFLLERKASTLTKQTTSS